MALYVLGDPHLSLGSNKPMDVFGGRWENYVEKLREGFSCLTPDDTLVLAGDISWGMDLPEALPDFTFLSRFPGKKILLKGNHDYWWNTVSKMENFLGREGLAGFSFLHNTCFFHEAPAGRLALCGTRGWFYEEGEAGGKVFQRELIRLETSLKAAGDCEKICFLHYPPYYQGYACEPILDLLSRYAVRRCYYGHLHGQSHRLACQGLRNGTEFRLISADYLHFRPEKISE